MRFIQFLLLLVPFYLVVACSPKTEVSTTTDITVFDTTSEAAVYDSLSKFRNELSEHDYLQVLTIIILEGARSSESVIAMNAVYNAHRSAEETIVSGTINQRYLDNIIAGAKGDDPITLGGLNSDELLHRYREAHKENIEWRADFLEKKLVSLRGNIPRYEKNLSELIDIQNKMNSGKSFSIRDTKVQDWHVRDAIEGCQRGLDSLLTEFIPKAQEFVDLYKAGSGYPEKDIWTQGATVRVKPSSTCDLARYL